MMVSGTIDMSSNLVGSTFQSKAFSHKSKGFFYGYFVFLALIATTVIPGAGIVRLQIKIEREFNAIFGNTGMVQVIEPPNAIHS